MTNDQPSDSAPEQPQPSTHVNARDPMGRPVQIPRDQYQQKVLPDMLKAHNDNPDQLAAVLMQAVRDGFAEDVIAAANRLTVIDKNIERALSVLALVQREAGELDMAELTMRELREKKPDSAAALVGLGLLADKRGDTDKAQELLWQAMELDCNSPDAVHAYLTLQHRIVGDDGYQAAADKAAALPGAWRPQLWLARHHLQQKNVDAATAIYREILAREDAVSEAMVMASTDLLNAQQADLLEELIAPRFQPGKHHPHTGVALLHHRRARQEHVEGEELLHQMWLHYGQMIAAELQPFTAEFDRMRLSKVEPPKDLGAQPRIGLYRMDRPAWWAGLDGPDWLLPQKAQGSKNIVCVGLSIGGQLPQGREEELGRWTRSVPTWLTEQIWLASPHRAQTAIPLAENGTWALMGQPFPEAQFVTQIPEAERADTILVTGQMMIDGDRRRIELYTYDCGQNARTGTVVAEGTDHDFGPMLLKLMAELWPLIGGPADMKPQVGDSGFWHRYVDGLGQHSSLVVTHSGGMPKERLFGARYIAQWVQMTMLAETRWQPGMWMFASTLSLLHGLGSKVPLEHARVLAEIFPQLPPDSAFARLAAKPLIECGMQQVWQSRRDEIRAAAQADANVIAWLDKVEAAGA